MQVEVNKNELAGALSALGKLVCRTSPVEAYRSIQITGKENNLHFRTVSTDESIEFKINVENELCEEFSVIVGFEMFRLAVRGCKNKSIVFEYADGCLTIDGNKMPSVECEFPKALDVPDGAKSEQLPVTFVEMLNMAAPVVNRNDYRKVLQGINLSKDGITVTNGKELFNVPIQMEVESLTIPFPLALIATKAEGASWLHYWTDGSQVFFRIIAGRWSWISKAVTGPYPNWKLVMPEQNSLKHSVTFTVERAEQLKSWLKNVPDDPPNNGIEIRRSNDTLVLNNLKGLEAGITAYFTGDWNDYKLTVNRDILLRLLNEGHTKMECQDGHGPFLATGGIGQYIAMPLYHPQPEKKEEPKVEPEVDKQTTKETKPMIDNTTIVSAPVQAAAINNEPVTEVTPLEELTATIEAFKAKLKGIFDESNVLSRKVKEVAILQKQKERDFILAKRAIERIRLASSF